MMVTILTLYSCHDSCGLGNICKCNRSKGFLYTLIVNFQSHLWVTFGLGDVFLAESVIHEQCT